MQVVSTVDRYPLSPMQQGMLFHHMMAGATGADLEQIVVSLPEDLDVDAFERAWALVIAGEPALRTSFRWRDLDRPVQEVDDGVAPIWLTEDWRGCGAEEQDRRLEEYLREDRHRGFALDRAPLLRLALFRTGAAAYRVVWSFPHIILDGRSFPLILNRVFDAYDTIRRGGAWTAPAVPAYRDYIGWLGTQDSSRAEDFWRGLLAGLGAPTQLAATAAAGEATGEGRGEQSVFLSRDTTEALEAVSGAHGLTLNTIVQGCWAILLSRWSGEEDVTFGATRACRRSTVAGAESIAGLFINTLPVHVQATPETRLIPWLRELRAQGLAVREFEHTPLVDVQRWSGIAGGASLFESIIVFDSASLDATLRSQGGAWSRRRFELREQTTYPLTLYGYGGDELQLKLAYDRARFTDDAITRMLGHLRTLLEGVAANEERTVGDLPMLTAAERRTLLEEWNDTAIDYPTDRCIHHLIEAQAARTPDATALICGEERLTYRELDARANKLARFLLERGVGPDVLVGLYLERSVEMVVAMLGVHKAGGAYVPLDPTYPRDRIAFMIEDAAMPVLLTQERLVADVPATQATVVAIDARWDEIAALSDATPQAPVAPANLAYVIYTSGSTGKPKGVMVEHRNVVNFFAGMDERIAHDPAGTWLAVTSLSFDISVLELLWTLARGFTVVLYTGDSADLVASAAPASPATKQVSFSLFYFASGGDGTAGDTYELLLEGAKFADRHGFEAVWTPERHFHDFGGLFPNPSVTGAAVAAVTERVKVRAGSVVLPLHSPIRVAEEWSVVDNLSRGRAGISVASGWQPNDFVLKPENYATAKAVMAREIETVRRLWRGETLPFLGPDGRDVDVRILPRPVQPELPLWVTAAGSPETFRLAGELGANVLTHLLGQSVEEVAEKIAVYRRAWREHGHAGEGRVTLMLHTFVGDDEEAVRETVRGPMKAYLRSSLGLIKGVAASYPVFKNRAGGVSEDELLAGLSEGEMDALLDYSFERYYETSGLFGTPERCVDIVERLAALGVDELGCLIDFGVETRAVLDGLARLDAVKERVTRATTPAGDGSIPALIAQHGVTHLQCTPSMATMLVVDERTRESLRSLRQMMVGGEAFPAALAAELTALVSGEVTNMYGPTETTIWSSTQAVASAATSAVPIGTPIANTQLYILDRAGQPAPVGVAGELLIGGDGVVRGYLNRPELTAERFTPNRFVADPAARVYRTGDLARYLPDGAVEFLGRMDHQVKIRGYRIELGEIESLLNEQPGVREAVVIAREDTPGATRLVAYVVAEPGATPEAATLRASLAAALPDFMVPAQVVFLDRFPLTPNAKIDRKALPQPDGAASATPVTSAPPAGGMEETVAAIWRDVLNLAVVGRDDNFFDLGGHSLLAVQVHRRLSMIAGPCLSLTDLFRFPTVRALSGFLEEGVGGDGVLSQGAARAEARQEALARRRGRVLAARV